MGSPQTERVRARRETRVPQLGTYEALVEEMALELRLTKKTERALLEAKRRRDEPKTRRAA